MADLPILGPQTEIRETKIGLEATLYVFSGMRSMGYPGRFRCVS
jgi:hypothetical protein